jgi:hypothetical protein
LFLIGFATLAGRSGVSGGAPQSAQAVWILLLIGVATLAGSFGVMHVKWSQAVFSSRWGARRSWSFSSLTCLPFCHRNLRLR